MNIKPLLPLALAASLLSACGDDALTDQPDNALRLQSVSVADDALAGTTRATLGATAPISAIGIYATTSAHAALENNAQSVFSKKGGTWSCDTPPEIASQETAPDYIYAFSPETSKVTHSATGAHTIPVTVGNDNFSATLQTDYLYATPQQAYAGKRTVSFEMLHALAKVSFKILKSQYVSEPMTLTKVELLSPTNRIQTGTGTMNIGTGKLTSLTDASLLTLTGSTVLKKETDADVDTPNVTCLVAPMPGEENALSFRLTVAVGAADSAATLVFETGAVKTAQQWKAGMHYVYKIIVSKMGGGLSGVQMDDWKNDASQDTSIGI